MQEDSRKPILRAHVMASPSPEITAAKAVALALLQKYAGLRDTVSKRKATTTDPANCKPAVAGDKMSAARLNPNSAAAKLIMKPQSQVSTIPSNLSSGKDPVTATVKTVDADKPSITANTAFKTSPVTGKTLISVPETSKPVVILATQPDAALVGTNKLPQFSPPATPPRGTPTKPPLSTETEQAKVAPVVQITGLDESRISRTEMAAMMQTAARSTRHDVKLVYDELKLVKEEMKIMKNICAQLLNLSGNERLMVSKCTQNLQAYTNQTYCCSR